MEDTKTAGPRLGDMERLDPDAYRGRVGRTLVTLARRRGGNGAWEATAWPHDGCATMSTRNDDPERALAGLARMLERRA